MRFMSSCASSSFAKPHLASHRRKSPDHWRDLARSAGAEKPVAEIFAGHYTALWKAQESFVKPKAAMMRHPR